MTADAAVINLGVSGYTSLQGYASLVNAIAPLSESGNDMGVTVFTEFAHTPATAHFLGHSAGQ